MTKIYGWKRDKHQHTHLNIKNKKKFPPTIILDNMPEVYNQGQLGSCTANALSGAFQREQIRSKLPDFVPSRLFIYYGERSLEGTVNSDSGAAIEDGIKVLSTIGVCDEIIWPYEIGKFTIKPSNNAYTVALEHNILQFNKVDPDPAHFKMMIKLGYPIVFGFTVYESFKTIGADGIMHSPKHGEKILGGHAVMAMGYDDHKHSIKVRNSWGPHWGLEGYFWMPYSFLNATNCGDCWVISKTEGSFQKLVDEEEQEQEQEQKE
jgi:C1A family cysteine protease